RRVEECEFRYPVACSDAEVEPTPGDQVDRRALLGQFCRVVQRGDDDRGAEPDALGAGGDRRGERQRLAEVVVVEEVMFGEPGRTRAEPVSLLTRLDGEPVERRRVLPPPMGVAEIEVNPDFHSIPSR